MNLSPLPPGVYEETFTYSNGSQQAVYRAPYESDGPRLLNQYGGRVLAYMYAAYVFKWPEGTTKVDVGHGSIDEHMELWSGVPISGRWHPDRLIDFAQEWATAEFRRYSR